MLIGITLSAIAQQRPVERESRQAPTVRDSLKPARSALTPIYTPRKDSPNATTGKYTGTIIIDSNVPPGAISVTYNGEAIPVLRDGHFTVDTIADYRLVVKSSGYETHRVKVKSPEDLQVVMLPQEPARMSISVGLHMVLRPLPARFRNYAGGYFEDRIVQIFGMGTGGGLQVYALNLKNFSAGAQLSYAWGWGIDPNDEYSTPYGINFTTVDYSYFIPGFGIDLSYGTRRFRMLAGYKFSLQMHDYLMQRIEDDYLIEETRAIGHVKREGIIAGIRLLGFRTKHMWEALGIDIAATFSKDRGWGDFYTDGAGLNFPWQYGFRLAIWSPGILRAELDLSFVPMPLINSYGVQLYYRQQYMQIRILYEIGWALRKR